jgi:hypothetical protein
MAREPAQRTLTIHLVNKELTDADSILRPGTDYSPVLVKGRPFGDLYVKVGELHSPPWVKFFGDAVDLARVQGISTAAVLLLSVRKRLRRHVWVRTYAAAAWYYGCQGRSKTRPLGRRESRPLHG